MVVSVGYWAALARGGERGGGRVDTALAICQIGTAMGKGEKVTQGERQREKEKIEHRIEKRSKERRKTTWMEREEIYGKERGKGIENEKG